MKAARNLGFAAILFFVISYFLPAYGNGSGFSCFGYCWSMLLGQDVEILTGGWFYYSGFLISNILFVGLVVALLVTKKRSRVRSVVSAIIFLHVLSWLVVNLISGKPSQVAEIKIGYYVWLMAYGLLAAAHLWKVPAESPGSIPFAKSFV